MTPAGLTQLKADEGLKLKPYWDRTGGPVVFDEAKGFLTIGYGRNLATRGISYAEAEQMLEADLLTMWASVVKFLPFLAHISNVRQDVFLMVEYNTGSLANFKRMIEYASVADWKNSAAELLNSDAARQLPNRYARLAAALISGSW